MNAVIDFWNQFWELFPTFMPRLLLAWLITAVVLCTGFRGMKKYVREHLIAVDKEIRAWALTLRFREPQTETSERVARTWFFRFWTNFASAPSVLTLSFVVAIWAEATQTKPVIFFLPGLCFASSMALSFVSKRVFKRARPERKQGSFGHKMKDASFPSGHSLTAFCFWFMLAVAVFLATLSVPFTVLATVLAITIVSLTGLSRIYLGVHFPSDVFGGYTIGIVWCFVCYFALRPIF